MGRYELYKHDTSVLLEWLAGVEQIVGSDACARYLVKAQTVPLKAWKETAQIVAQSLKPRAIIPVDVLRSGQNAIKIRNEYSEWFKSNGGETHSNAAHEAFNSMMMEVVSILAQRRKLIGEQRALKGAPSNYFSILSEQSTSKTHPEPTIATHSQSSKPSRQRTTVDHEEDLRFKLYCFLEDAQDLRTHVSETWHRYHLGKASLVVAASITNRAVQQVTESEEHLIGLHPELLSKKTSCTKVTQLFSAPHPGKGQGTQNPLAETWRKTYVSTSSAIFTIAAACRARKAVDLSDLSFLEVDTVDEASLQEVEFLSRFTIHAHLHGLLERSGGERVLPEDEITKTFVRLCFDAEETITVVFATRLLLDIRHELGKNNASGYENLLHEADRYCKALGFQIDGKGTIKHFSPRYAWHEKHLPELQKFGRLLQTIKSKPTIAEGRITLEFVSKNEPKSHGTKRVSSYVGTSRQLTSLMDCFREGDFLFTQHPTYCGTISFEILSQGEITGIAHAIHHSYIFAMAHLYNALKENGMLTAKWQDLEDVMDIYQRDIFGQERPKTPRSILTSLRIRAGFSFVHSAPDAAGRCRGKEYRWIGKPSLGTSMSSTTLRSQTHYGSEPLTASLQKIEETLIKDARRLELIHFELTQRCGNLLSMIRTCIKRELKITHDPHHINGDSWDRGLIQMVYIILLTLSENKWDQLRVAGVLMGKMIPTLVVQKEYTVAGKSSLVESE